MQEKERTTEYVAVAADEAAVAIVTVAGAETSSGPLQMT